MAQFNTNQPVYILPEGTERFSGKDARRMNIMAGKVLAETIRTTLGPKGMDKMLINGLGDVVITNDGVTILREMDIAHPAAKMLVEIAKNQEDEVGDGTTTAVIIAGELLKKAEELMESGIHASIIVLGYIKAINKAQDLLQDISLDACDEDTLLKVGMTAMTGKGSEAAKESLAQLLVDAVNKVEEDRKVDKDLINIHRISGASIAESSLVNGILIDKTIADAGMPKKIENAKIAILKYPIEIKDLETNAKINLIDPAQMQAFLDNEEQIIRGMVDKIVASGANVLVCQKGIDEVALSHLAKEGIMAIKRARKTDIARIEKATGAKLVTNIDDLNSSSLGEAGLVYEKKIFDNIMVFFEECNEPKAVSIILRGSTRHVTEEIERALEDALGVVSATIEDGKVVVGGGAPEIAIAKGLKEYSETISGREQLAIKAFAEALEVVPRTLAENAGLDSIDVLVDLRAAHEKSSAMGINVFTGKVIDMKEEAVIEPQCVKKQAIYSAAEVCKMILRIDDMIAARGGLEATSDDDMGDMPPGMPGVGGMPGGMGGMSPMM